MAPPPAPSSEPEICEWHFHVYWFARNKKSGEEASALRAKLVEKVKADPTFIAVFNDSADLFPGLIQRPPPINHEPVGPHVSGSFEVWVPRESIAAALSWFTLNHGNLSVLFHPLTRYELRDHTEGAMWLGKQWVIDLSVLSEDLGAPPAQYKELGYGYSRVES
ncbi:TPA: hypothetical protein N0F65_005957 [Lagenidium giganteum]|uniref:DOPA 4,5-dioxygenase n=1 Tax=Lagenidium giganteum TaxID=4803 RepID=A0AAV2ZEF3_9STRA|nr:TPA: hypothetical protein N0F65_005957 [Lagenidium giganteum]